MIQQTQQLSVLGLPYFRAIIETVDPTEIEKLKQKFFYIHLYSYQPVNLPDFSEQQQIISVIDLGQDETTVFQGFKKNTRNEIHKTEHLAKISFRIPDPDVITSYRFYRQIKRRDGVIPDHRQEFTNCLFFNAYSNATLIVSLSCYQAGNIIRLKHVVSVRKQAEIDSRLVGYASRRLVWEICKYAKHHNYRWFDLAGVNLSDQKKSGVAQFKQSFGGELKTNYVYRYERPLFLLVIKIFKFLVYNIH